MPLKQNAMYGKIKDFLSTELKNIEEAGIFKKERIITSPQGATVTVSSGDDVVIMCANNYLGLSSHPDVVNGAKEALDSHGYGMSSVRFICGTQDIHKTLDKHKMIKVVIKMIINTKVDKYFSRIFELIYPINA